MAKFTYSLVFTIAASLTVVTAVSKEEIAAFRQLARPIVADCSKEFSVIRDDIETNDDGGIINPCFTACILKKTEVLDSNGFYDADMSISNLRLFVTDDNKLAKFENIFKQCSKVNDVPVSDGAKGCERANLLVECAFDNVPQIQSFY